MIKHKLHIILLYVGMEVKRIIFLWANSYYVIYGITIYFFDFKANDIWAEKVISTSSFSIQRSMVKLFVIGLKNISCHTQVFRISVHRKVGSIWDGALNCRMRTATAADSIMRRCSHDWIF